MMKRKIQVVAVIVALCMPLLSRGNDVSTIYQQWLESQMKVFYSEREQLELIQNIQEKSMSPDIMIRELYDVRDDEKVKCLLTTYSNGKWGDIRYDDQSRSGWAPLKHPERLTTLCRSYISVESSFYKDKYLKRVILEAIDFWHESALRCPNWWYNEIGVPKMMGQVYLYMKSELSGDQLLAADKCMSQSRIRMTGQNRCWLAGNVLMKGLLLDDDREIKRAVTALSEEIVVGQKEGIKGDWTFHQHGAQQQNGNYGLAYINSLSYWAYVLRGTSYSFTQDKLEILHHFLMEGLQWVMWRGHMDFSSCGRQLFKYAEAGKALSVGKALSFMRVVLPDREKEYSQFFEQHILGSSKKQSLVGVRYFPDSHMLVNRTDHFYFSLKMSSNRVIGSEIINNENLLGYYLGAGATAIYRTGAEYQDVYPVWNWSLVPGVTAYNDAQILGQRKGAYASNQSNFVGGMAFEQVGVATEFFCMDALTAFKSWFTLGDYIVCMGSEIENGLSLPLRTTINQTNLMGRVVQHDLKDRVVVSHNNIHYHCYNPEALCVEHEMKEGHWNRVAHFYPEKEVVTPVFTLSIDHETPQKSNEYLYVIDGKRKYSKHFPFEIVCTREGVHQIQWGSYILVAQKERGIIRLFSDVELSVSFGCVVIAKRHKDQIEVRIMDPANQNQAISIETNGLFVFENGTQKREVMLNEHDVSTFILHQRE